MAAGEPVDSSGRINEPARFLFNSRSSSCAYDDKTFLVREPQMGAFVHVLKKTVSHVRNSYAPDRTIFHLRTEGRGQGRNVPRALSPDLPQARLRAGSRCCI